MPVMGWKSSAVAKATINPCKICQRGATMPPNLGFDRWPRRPADGTPTCAHKPGRYRTPAGRIAGKKHRGCGGQNHHVRGQLSELPVSADKEGGPEKLPDDARGSRP